jgi:hypothetical protein
VCEIRLRAERKAGGLLAKMEKAKPGPIDRSGATTELPRLIDIGISRDQSSKWQRLAGVPQAEFDAALKDADRPTTDGIIRATAPASWKWG